MNLLVLGDSVCWGQGLIPEHKFANLLAVTLNASMQNRAHSGAVIGIGGSVRTAPAPGEVPLALPSILDQVRQSQDLREQNVVIINGGINDVDIRRILSPWTTIPQLDASVQQHCGKDMAELLSELGQRCDPKAIVVVPGYYPILSPDSTHFIHEEQFRLMLEMHGVAIGAASLETRFETRALLPPVTRNCVEFWHRSDEALAGAVAAANQRFAGSPRFVFAKLPFSEQNAVFASHPLLWGLTALLEAQDEVIAQRKPQCDAIFGDLIHLPNLLQCHRASAGHPNVEGASIIADTIRAALT